MWYLGSWMFPVISACMWLGMLLAMLIWWAAIEHHPIFPSMDRGQTIAYISDVGAFHLKPLFITGAVITTIFLDLGFMAERWLRHAGRLVPNTSLTQKILSVIAILFGIAGSAGLILLSIFDTYHHPRLHDGFLLLFIGGYWFSAVFLCAEYQRLGIHYRNHRILRISFWVKLMFILVELVLAIAFASTSYTGKPNVAAVFEWIVAFVFTAYVISFLLDLLPSVRTKHHRPQGWEQQAEIEKALNGQQPGSALTDDSAGPNANVDNEAIQNGYGYRGTNMAIDGAGHPTDDSDLGRQNRRGDALFYDRATGR